MDYMSKEAKRQAKAKRPFTVITPAQILAITPKSRRKGK